jgi:hypothetical protein
MMQIMAGRPQMKSLTAVFICAMSSISSYSFSGAEFPHSLDNLFYSISETYAIQESSKRMLFYSPSFDKIYKY